MALSPTWAVILAGGDGSRLRPLTRALAGDDRPKQFCRITGSRSLLGDTMTRVGQIVAPDRTLYVVSRRHAPFYRRDLMAMAPWQVLQQPESRGTTAAVACAVATIQARAGYAAQPIVGFFPADHHFTDTPTFRHALVWAYAAAANHPDRVVMVGAAATRAETDYGWIQPGAALDPARPSRRLTAVHEVIQFREKPSPALAAALLEQQCLWNTFISVGRVEAFARLLSDVVPRIWAPFEILSRLPHEAQHPTVVEAIYADLDVSDFSRDVLTQAPGRLAVVELPATAGWTDLGRPDRVLEALASHNGLRPMLRRARRA